MVNNWLNIIQMALLPGHCILCGSSTFNTLDLCPQCRSSLPSNDKPCRTCAIPLPDSSPADSLCGRCSKSQPEFHKIITPFSYQPPVDQLILKLKTGQHLPSGKVLGMLLADFLLQQHYPKPELLLPVPLFKQRLQKRRFNQSAEICRQLSKQLGIPWSSQSLKKTRETPSQSRLNKKQRLSNLKNSFQMKKKQGLNHVAIVDDVVTTSATAIEISRVLKRAGIKKVDILAIARTPFNR